MGGTRRLAIGAAGLFGATGVGLGAAAAHLRSLDAAHAAMLRHGVEMEIWHALALLGAASVARGVAGRLAVGGFVAGTLLFCVPVDALAFGHGSIVRAAPVGGMLLIASWVLLGLSAVRGQDPAR